MEVEDIIETGANSNTKTYTICGATYTATDVGICLASGVVGFGLALLIACYCVPRTPPPRNELGVTARQYEKLENEFVTRNFWMDVTMIISLGIMSVGGLALSMVHVYLYWTGYRAYVRKRDALNQRNRSEREGLVEMEMANYGAGGLQEPQ